MTRFGPAEHALHRYYLWANRLRLHFKSCGEPPTEKLQRQLWFNQSFAYLALWLGLLYVVVEGWRDLEHSDDSISPLLESPNVELLRRFRNGAFHFQSDYFDKRFTDLLFGPNAPLLWAEEVHQALGDWFIKEAKSLGITIEVIRDETQPEAG